MRATQVRNFIKSIKNSNHLTVFVGGRIGPYLEGGTPDLRNIELFFTMCDENDLLIVMSDGAHGKYFRNVVCSF